VTSPPEPPPPLARTLTLKENSNSHCDFVAVKKIKKNQCQTSLKAASAEIQSAADFCGFSFCLQALRVRLALLDAAEFSREAIFLASLRRIQQFFFKKIHAPSHARTHTRSLARRMHARTRENELVRVRPHDFS
jgi:hypothetical protein